MANDHVSLSSQVSAFKARQALDAVQFAGKAVPGSTESDVITGQLRTSTATSSGWTPIEAIAKSENSEGLWNELLSLGIRDSQVYGRRVSGWLANSALDGLAQLDSLQFASVGQLELRTGNILSEGDQAMFADRARQQFNVGGRGVTVGVISDSFDCLAGAMDDQVNGELPDSFRILEEAVNCESRSDEGRALMQVIHDVAPEAMLAFHTSTNGVASFANGIMELATIAGADVIVDDSSPSYDLFFQDDIIAQAIERVSSMGVTYVTAAGNGARLSYESDYKRHISEHLGIQAHDFSNNSSMDVLQKITVDEGTSIDIVLQWDEPAFSVSGSPGTQKDLDIFITDANGTNILAGGAIDNIGKDPVELLRFENPMDSGQRDFNILIVNSGVGSPNLIKYAVTGRLYGSIDEYATQSSSIAGHSNALNAISIGAADYRNTPRFGVDPPVLQFFSSAGGTKILFSKSGERLPVPEVRLKPDIVGPDNINTSFFSGDDSDNDGYPNFLGTSAAAPHIAGAVALILEVNPFLQPKDIRKILHDTAVDMGARETRVSAANAGFDFDSGYGFVNVVKAIELARLTDAGASEDPSNGSSEPFVYQEAFGGAGSVDVFMAALVAFFLLLRRMRSWNSSASSLGKIENKMLLELQRHIR